MNASPATRSEIPAGTPATDQAELAPGSVVVVRDEEWLVTAVSPTLDGQLITCHGLSELVRDTTAQFYESLDDFHVLDPADAQPIADASPRYRQARLWVEAVLRKSSIPLVSPSLAVCSGMLMDQMEYQAKAVRQALSPENLRPRLLLADAVGLGKTLEIGMILSELVRRGRGSRILIVSPKHVLEQMQHEMWVRFGLPFVRLDSSGIQRVRQKLPATRNPFTLYKRAIISMDTLKSERYAAYLRQHRWDAVVIDESHNVTNTGTQNNRLASVLAPTTDALILASATPHNGKAESFAELVRLLEPTAVTPSGELVPEEVQRLVIRRHRHSPEVAGEVGSDWAEREEPKHIHVKASAAENRVVDELVETWLRPESGVSPYSGKTTALFPWTLAKAFLSSPDALQETITNRQKRLDTNLPTESREHVALDRLLSLTTNVSGKDCAKYSALLKHLKVLGVSKSSDMRVVVFAERVKTLEWLQTHLCKDLKLTGDNVPIMHGGLTDEQQQEIVESFKQSTSPIKVLVTGDIASEGVNLHQQCHQLVHFDIPWSLIRIEQRNGRVDRYGQKHGAVITTLILEPSNDEFAGDIRVLARLVDKEHEAHQALGDAASLMGQHSVKGEEDAIRRLFHEQRKLDEVVATPQVAVEQDPIMAMIMAAEAARADGSDESAQAGGDDGVEGCSELSTDDGSAFQGVYGSQVDFLRDAMVEAFETPEASVEAGGVGWREHPKEHMVEFVPPADLRQRLEVLPQSYIRDRQVMKSLKLVTDRVAGSRIVKAALSDELSSSWPAAHFLGPLHPVLEWASDRALASLGRGQVFAVRGSVPVPTVCVLVSLSNRRGQVVASSPVSVGFMSPTGAGLVTPFGSPEEMFADVGFAEGGVNPGPVAQTEWLPGLVRRAVEACEPQVSTLRQACDAEVEARVGRWVERVDAWNHEADALIQRSDVKGRRASVKQLGELVGQMRSDRALIRPLLVVLPEDHPIEGQ